MQQRPETGDGRLQYSEQKLGDQLQPGNKKGGNQQSGEEVVDRLRKHRAKGEVNSTDVVCLHFGRAFDCVCHNLLVDRLTKCGIDKWAVRWIEKGLNCWAGKVVIRSTKSSWKPVTNAVPSVYWVQCCLILC